MVADPDGVVLEARFFSPAEAIDNLRANPWRFCSEPTVAYLEGSVPAVAIFSYLRNAEGETRRRGIPTWSERHHRS